MRKFHSDEEERFTWIYDLAEKLEPKAKIYLWEDFQSDLEDTWEYRFQIKDMQKAHKFYEIELLCKDILRDYSLMHPFFSMLVEAYVKQNKLNEAAWLVFHRQEWLIARPYKTLHEWEIMQGIKKNYKQEMFDWISGMRTLQAHEIDLQEKMDAGYVYRPRK